MVYYGLVDLVVVVVVDGLVVAWDWLYWLLYAWVDDGMLFVVVGFVEVDWLFVDFMLVGCGVICMFVLFLIVDGVYLVVGWGFGVCTALVVEGVCFVGVVLVAVVEYLFVCCIYVLAFDGDGSVILRAAGDGDGDVGLVLRFVGVDWVIVFGVVWVLVCYDDFEVNVAGMLLVFFGFGALLGAEVFDVEALVR